MADVQDPTITSVGKKFKSMYPGDYDDLTDEDVGQRVKEKKPDVWADLSRPDPKQETFGDWAKDFIYSPHGFLAEGSRGLIDAARAFRRGDVGGVGTGLSQAVTNYAAPISIGAGMGFPVESLAAMGAGYAGQKAGESGSAALGASPESQKIWGDIAGLTAGALATGLTPNIVGGAGGAYRGFRDTPLKGHPYGRIILGEMAAESMGLPKGVGGTAGFMAPKIGGAVRGGFAGATRPGLSGFGFGSPGPINLRTSVDISDPVKPPKPLTKAEVTKAHEAGVYNYDQYEEGLRKAGHSEEDARTLRQTKEAEDWKEALEQEEKERFGRKITFKPARGTTQAPGTRSPSYSQPTMRGPTQEGPLVPGPVAPPAPDIPPGLQSSIDIQPTGIKYRRATGAGDVSAPGTPGTAFPVSRPGLQEGPFVRGPKPEPGAVVWDPERGHVQVPEEPVKPEVKPEPLTRKQKLMQQVRKALDDRRGSMRLPDWAQKLIEREPQEEPKNLPDVTIGPEGEINRVEAPRSGTLRPEAPAYKERETPSWKEREITGWLEKQLNDLKVPEDKRPAIRVAHDKMQQAMEEASGTPYVEKYGPERSKWPEEVNTAYDLSLRKMDVARENFAKLIREYNPPKKKPFFGSERGSIKISSPGKGIAQKLEKSIEIAKTGETPKPTVKETPEPARKTFISKMADMLQEHGLTHEHVEAADPKTLDQFSQIAGGPKSMSYSQIKALTEEMRQRGEAPKEVP